ncbi:MAG: PEP-CTERM sorting domain-containing protein [Gammaproteobacteria bacterium]|nr:PEP-CTERM sorting domain-containing protein [Gammaproteobacteria bacterium]
MPTMTKVILLSLFSGLGLTNVANAFVVWDAHTDGELHQYGVVYMAQTTWQEAHNYLAAGNQGEGWHLATITSAEEQSFMQTNLLQYTTGHKFWLGGWQELNALTPDLDWNWVTNEAWDYTNWGRIQPDDYDGREQRWLATTDLLNWHWDDQTIDMNSSTRISGFFIERSGKSVHVPEPSSFALLGIALTGFGFMQRRKSRKNA